MGFSFYSCLMAMITSTAMIIAIYFLKKSRLFTDAFGVSFMSMLYLLSLFRMFVAIEIPSIQIVIGESVFMPRLMDILNNCSPLTCNFGCRALYLFGSVSFLVTIVYVVTFCVRQYRFVSRVSKAENDVSPRELQLLQKTTLEVFNRKTKIKLIKSDDVSVPMVLGMVRRVVVIENRAYTDEELELILLHECMHIKNHDLWLKFLVCMFCCLYWFNPFVYLLKSDIDFVLELKCDNAVCRHLDENKKLSYAEFINNTARNCCSKQINAAVLSSRFAVNKSTEKHIYRMNNLLFEKRKCHKTPVVIVCVFMIVLYMLSYVFILEPDYSAGINSNTQTQYLVESTADQL